MKKLSIIAAALAILAACIPDDRENFMVPDSFGLTATDDLVQASVHAGSYTFGVAKNGKGQTEATAAVSIDSDGAAKAVSEYNKANGTEYKMLSPSLFTLDNNVLAFGEKEVVRNVTISWDPLKVIDAISDGAAYVIPIALSSNDLTVNPNNGFLLVTFLRSSLGIAQKNIGRVINHKQVEPDPDGVMPELKEVVMLDVSMDNFIKDVGMTFPVKIDNSLIEKANEGLDEPYVAAPEGLVNILTPTVTIPESGESATFKIEIDKSKLLAGGKLQAFPNYLIPVTIDTGAMSATRKGEPFDLKGLSYGNLVTYVSLSYLEAGLSVVREWGYFSTESGSWSNFIDGFTANADRNVAIDDNYIYIAETNTTKHLWAISIKDPRNYRLLPVETVKDAGIFYLSCPRIMKNTDPEINGGKDVLMVCSMNEGNFYVYAYDKGIDENPTAMFMDTFNASYRRLGDTFMPWGSVQSGMLFFKDFNSAQGTVTFKLFGKLGGLWLQGRVVTPPAAGAGAYFPFPDDINSGVASVRGGDTAWLTTASKDLFNLEGADSSPVLTELGEDYADSAFRYFDLGNRRYVAYTRQLDSYSGRVIIIEGTPEQSWKDIILEHNVVYQAAIQNDSDQDKISDDPSPAGSGNSGMDLGIRKVGEDVYMAVIKQNVGLSLFKLTYIY